MTQAAPRDRRPLSREGRERDALKPHDRAASIQIITPGWGSSGYYSAEVLEAGRDRPGHPRRHPHVRRPPHATPSDAERPARDVEKTRRPSSSRTPPGTAPGSRSPRSSSAPHARASSRSVAPTSACRSAGPPPTSSMGEAEGRTRPDHRGPRAPSCRVDFVTRAGRGGKVLLESWTPVPPTPERRHHGVAEATANDTREALQTVLRDAYGGDEDLGSGSATSTTAHRLVRASRRRRDATGIYGQTYTSTTTASAP